MPRNFCRAAKPHFTVWHRVDAPLHTWVIDKSVAMEWYNITKRCYILQLHYTVIFCTSQLHCEQYVLRSAVRHSVTLHVCTHLQIHIPFILVTLSCSCFTFSSLYSIHNWILRNKRGEEQTFLIVPTDHTVFQHSNSSHSSAGQPLLHHFPKMRYF